jgi:multiple sugar transport system ATP-binding protein
MRAEIKELHQRLKTTSIYVTHDQIEAMTMGDKIVVMRDGRIEQTGSPLDLYDHPANQFVAQFIGTPQMNVVAAKDLPQLEAACGLKAPPGGFVGLRPENITLRPAGGGVLQGRVELVEALGAETLIYLSTEHGAQLVARQNSRTPLHAGDTVGVEIDADAAHLFDAHGHVARTGRTSVTQALTH